ncbi:MAG: hypothetical protein U0R21_10380 [Nocardioidaceae bacterium]|nr:hypothetical protein [Marmoricola sp.]HNI70412.1 hypothetical protein [Marmoricola sp.]
MAPSANLGAIRKAIRRAWRTTDSRVVTGTKTAIAVQGSVNRWVNTPDPLITSEQLGDFLAESLWQVLQSTMAATGVETSAYALVAGLV